MIAPFLLPHDAAIAVILEALNFSDKFKYWESIPSPELENYYQRLFGSARLQSEKDTNGCPKDYESMLSWEHCLHSVLRSVAFDESYFSFIAAKVIPDSSRRRTYLLLIERLLDAGNLDRARHYIELIPDSVVSNNENMKYQGHRAVAKWYAGKGDLDNFLKTLKQCNAKKDRHEIETVKYLLIQNYTSANGVGQRLELLKRKEFGAKYHYACFLSLVETASYGELKSAVDTHIGESLNTDWVRQRLLVKSFVKNIAKEFSSSEFDYLFDQIGIIPADVKWGDGGLKDFLFVDLGASTEDLALVTRCYKAIQGRRLKTELGYHLNRVKGTG